VASINGRNSLPILIHCEMFWGLIWSRVKGNEYGEHCTDQG
jgi:hypothetical protein